MGNDVFANGREVSCKAASGKSICAFPDVCFTPPENPATPPGVPVPYPNTGKASDMTSGSKKVKVSKKEVVQKNKSYFKKSMGDEAGCAAKKGVITSTNRGKVYFNAWSMDVKFEGENVVRHLDLTTHNHMSQTGQTPPWPYADSAAMGTGEDPCEEDKKKEQDACRGKNEQEACDDDNCQKARKCKLVPHGGSGSPNCCPGQTSHHLVEVHGFMSDRKAGKNLPQFPDYDEFAAPCVCAECPRGSRFRGEHGDLHAVQGVLELGAMANAPAGMKGMAWNYGQARDAGIKAHAATFPDSDCDPKCLSAQIDNYHQNDPMNLTDNTPLKTGPGSLGVNPTSQWQRGIELLERLARRMKSMTGV